jgi:hypothetical protein
LPRFLRVWRERAFPLRGVQFGFWVVTVNPGFISCYDSKGSSGHVCLHPTGPGKQTHAAASARWWATEAHTLEICHMFKSSVSIHWHVPCKIPNLPVISEMVLRLSSLTIFQAISTSLCDLWNDDLNAQILQLKFPYVWFRKSIKSLCSACGIDTESCCVSCISNAVFLS